jgi:uncharacterized protein (DUF488 family)
MNGIQTARRSLFTIGHSDHHIDRFLDLVREYRVDAVADVRSQPYSRHQPQFNRESLAEALKRIDAKYVFLGRELGARRSEPEGYDGGRARYDLIRHLPAFQEGLARIQRGVESNRIALLCAEKDPVTCHRAILVCRELRAMPIDILHIREDGLRETTAAIETRLLRLWRLDSADLFSERTALIELAYDKQAERIAYVATEEIRQGEEARP